MKKLSIALLLSFISFNSYAVKMCYFYHIEHNIATGELEVPYQLYKTEKTNGDCDSMDHFNQISSVTYSELSKIVTEGQTQNGGSECRVTIRWVNFGATGIIR